ncbi:MULTISPECIES: sensor histidine kinase [unclassified Streptomyces]|uniref:sensor histidine kinase n=1 Tax=unclassified Streptomyces TaxID=2593676 RepID=UPI002E79DEEC|nr:MULTISPECIES: histidine kinase [unclassified Streptomyces]MEE1761374.1 histidine kinase [Streptomyces sp. SP18BB07]MEE1836071.1 histidine kinase [Streptomyces sp. SP17KL33]
MSRSKGRRWAAFGRVSLVLVCVLAALLNAASTDAASFLVPVTVAALLCGAALLVPRLRWPVAPLLVTVATAWWGWPLLPLMVLALFSLAVDLRARAAVGCAVAALGANLLSHSATSLWTSQSYASTVLLPTLAVVVGLWLGNRRRLLEALAADVEHLRTESKLREEAARAAERSRIAVEMHDVLAHRLSLIALHTGVLTTRGDALPAPVADRLGLLRVTSVEALTDLRDVLGALHTPDGTQTGSELSPVMREVRELVEEARAAGQQVELSFHGLPEQAPITHRLAVHRLVQEALTNARKHAHGAQVTVRVDYRAPATLVEVGNTPGTPRTDTPGSGYGLVGLRERVSALGGELTAGPAGAGAWRLAARIPHPAGIEKNGSAT